MDRSADNGLGETASRLKGPRSGSRGKKAQRLRRRKELVPQLLGQYLFLPGNDSYHQIGGYTFRKDLEAEGLAQHSLDAVTPVSFTTLPANHNPQSWMTTSIRESSGSQQILPVFDAPFENRPIILSGE